MVANDLGDDETQELLGEDRVQARLGGKFAQPRHLLHLASRVGRRQPHGRLEDPHLLRAAEALGQQVDQGSVEVVDARAQSDQLGRDLGGGAHQVRVRYVAPFNPPELQMTGRTPVFVVTSHPHLGPVGTHAF